MAQAPAITVEKRSGKANRLRNQGLVPGIVYGHGIKNINIAVDARAMAKLFAAAGHTTLIDLDVAGKKHNVLIREIQFHPVHGSLDHVDFYQVRLDEEISADVSIDYVGESSAVKDLGGVLIRNLDTIEVRALPQNLPHYIQVDISVITQLDMPIRTADLTLPAGVTVINEADEVIAFVQPPRTEEELKSLEEEVKEDVESVEGVEEKKTDEITDEDAETDNKEVKTAAK